jgi:hypothetical protein
MQFTTAKHAIEQALHAVTLVMVATVTLKLLQGIL